jgi:sugar phosphate isomerase/epimerase
VVRSVGYDNFVSIEHEDPYMSVDEGLDKAVANLRQVLMFQPAARPKAVDLDE